MVSGSNPAVLQQSRRRGQLRTISGSASGGWALGGLLCLAIAVVIGIGNSVLSATQNPSAAPLPAGPVTPAPSPLPSFAGPPVAGATARLPSSSDIIGYLGSVISWYREQDQEIRLARAPAEALIAADDQRMAGNILNLAIEAARAAAAMINSEGGASSATPSSSPSGSGNQAPYPAALNGDMETLAAKQSEGQAQIGSDNSLITDLQNRLHRARRRDRPMLQEALANAQAKLQFDQSRLDAIGEIADFESSEHAGSSGSSGTLLGQIDELQRSVAPPADQSQQSVTSSAASASNDAEPLGLLGNLQLLIRLMRENSELQDAIARTIALRNAAQNYRAPIARSVTEIYDQAVKLADRASTGDYAAVQKNSNDFQQLAALHKLIVPALLPLSKQELLLNLYVSNLQRWRAFVGERIKEELRALAWRLSALAALLALVAGGAIIWRRLTFRYVQDFQRRHILMQLRRVAVGIVVSLIIVFGFASELGTLGTVIGFAAAGIALALQNVILSLAGYFYLSGRYGIRVNDRIQLSGISGDVLEIGLFRMTLMELSNDDFGFQATGRVVVFPNSVVFQPNGNFFKQLPGSSFMWSELRLTLAPDCDYRLAEKKILEVVNDVFARYRDSVQRESRRVELDLNIKFEMPKPQSRIELRPSGLAMVIRYPVPLQSAVQTADEIARRLVDAISREPELELATQGTPSLRPAPVAAHPPDPAATAKMDARKP
jgi:small-conductance mechanosensitive channel